jgi:hypothetical protein
MHFGPRLFRVSLWLASTSLACGTMPPAWAQPAAPQSPAPPAAPGAPGPDAGSNAGDPPTLAGRLAAVSGTVSTHGAGQTEWTPATLNTPVTNGDSFWTQPQSSATIEVGADRFVLNETTELDIASLDQSQFIGSAAQGEIYLALPELPQGQSFTINTPRGGVQISATGQYDIVAGDSATPTTVTVISGGATVTGAGVNLTVGVNQEATITGTDHLVGVVGTVAPTPFLQAQLKLQTMPELPNGCPPEVRNMTGGTDLVHYGSFQSTPQYGQVWYPNNVPNDWAPYRAGRWSYVGPWGWTWVDSQPWGFAPFHYGRWVSYGGRWGWVAGAPGITVGVGAYPVYAPALVGFVGIGGAALVGASINFGVGFGGVGFGFGGGGIGWVPLGFGEPFRPWYHVSNGYFQNVNRFSVVNYHNLTINNYRSVNVTNYANARFATVAPAGALQRGMPLQGIARPLPASVLAHATPSVLAHATPVEGRLPVNPTAQTPGLTRAEARRFNVALPARPAGPVAPGPAVHPGESLSHPALRPAGAAASREGAAEATRPGGVRPGEVPAAGRAGLPPLRPASEARTRPEITPHEGGSATRPATGAENRPAAAEHNQAEHTGAATRAATSTRAAESHGPTHAATERSDEARHAPEARHVEEHHPAAAARHTEEHHPAAEARPAAEHRPAPEARHVEEHRPAPAAHPAPHPAPAPARAHGEEKHPK